MKSNNPVNSKHSFPFSLSPLTPCSSGALQLPPILRSLEKKKESGDMAKEVDLKKIELKVYVHCCDGCKRKVKKVLRSVEGVLKTEIDPSQPKVTVLGNVDSQILIRKLLKAGKQAEIWSNGNQNAVKEKKEVETAGMREKEKSKSGCEQARPTDSCGTDTNKNKKITISGDAGGNRACKKDQETDQRSVNTPILKITNSESALPPHQEVNSTVYPSMSHDMSSIKSYTQNPHMVEPYTINLPYYAIRSFIAPLHPTCYGHEHYYCGMPVPQPPVQTSAAPRAVDYFSDENTVGCYLM